MRDLDHYAGRRAGLSRRTVLRLASASALCVAGSALTACDTLTALSPARQAPRVEPDVRVSDDGLEWHAETAIAANPRDARNLVAACIAGSSSIPAVIATYASFDGGRSWQSNGALPGSEDGRDPTVAFTESGEGFVCANTGLVSVWRTSDGGRTFAPFVGLSAMDDAAPPRTDHPWLATAPKSGDLFAAWSVDSNTRLGFARSRDGGRSFEAPRIIASESGRIAAAPMICAGRDGLVCAVYGAWPQTVVSATTKATAKGGRGEVVAPIMAVCSTDAGDSFAPPLALGDAAMETPLPDGANAISLPTVTAGPGARDLHVALVTRRPGAIASVIAVRSSRDGGRTWSLPSEVTPESSGVFYFQPQLAVDKTGRLGLSAFVLQGNKAQTVLFTRVGAGAFSPPIVLSSQTFDPAIGSLPGGSKHGTWWIGDYQGLTATSDGFHALWNDTRTSRLELFAAAVRM